MHSRFAKFCWATLAYNILVILWGAFVRATDSGAGCGSHWPLCNGEVVPRAPSLETLIELSHRLTSGVALLLVMAMVIWAFRAFPRGHRVRKAAMASLLLIFVEAGIGAGIVLFELVADNESMARALFMGTHLMNTFFLLAALVVTAYWASGGEAVRWSGATVSKGERWAYRVAIVGTILVGISGAVAALGDTLFPAGSLEEALRQDWSPTSHVLLRLRLLHPLIACLTGLVLFFLGRDTARRDTSPLCRRLAHALVLTVLVQLALGVLNVILLAPVWMQMVHLLVADILWLLLILMLAARWRVRS